MSMKTPVHLNKLKKRLQDLDDFTYEKETQAELRRILRETPYAYMVPFFVVLRERIHKQFLLARMLGETNADLEHLLEPCELKRKHRSGGVCNALVETKLTLHTVSLTRKQSVRTVRLGATTNTPPTSVAPVRLKVAWFVFANNNLLDTHATTHSHAEHSSMSSMWRNCISDWVPFQKEVLFDLANKVFDELLKHVARQCSSGGDAATDIVYRLGKRFLNVHDLQTATQVGYVACWLNVVLERGLLKETRAIKRLVNNLNAAAVQLLEKRDMQTLQRILERYVTEETETT